MSRPRGRELLGNGSGLGPPSDITELLLFRTFLPCHFVSITIDVGNVEEGGAAVLMATVVSECQNTEALDATFRLWTLNWGIV